VAVWVRHVRRIPRDLVSRFLIPRAQAIVDTPRARSPDELGSRYFGGDIRDLCDQRGDFARLSAAIAPLVVRVPSCGSALRHPGSVRLPHGHDPTDRPSMGSLWCRPVQTSYIFSLIFIKFGRS
jgi:hypothetical protein